MTPAMMPAADRPFSPDAVALLELLNQMRATAEQRRAIQQIIDAAGVGTALRTVCVWMAQVYAAAAGPD